MKGEEMERYSACFGLAYAANAEIYRCSDCGSLVFDTEAHDRWHGTGQTDDQMQEVRVRIAMQFESEAEMAGFVEGAIRLAIEGRTEPPLDGTPIAVVFRGEDGREMVYQDGHGAREDVRASLAHPVTP